VLIIVNVKSDVGSPVPLQAATSAPPPRCLSLRLCYWHAVIQDSIAVLHRLVQPEFAIPYLPQLGTPLATWCAGPDGDNLSLKNIKIIEAITYVTNITYRERVEP
jgi:hypothetical protein